MTDKGSIHSQTKKTKGSNLYSFDTSIGCTGECIGCYAKSTSRYRVPDLDFKNPAPIKLKGKPADGYSFFLWTSARSVFFMDLIGLLEEKKAGIILSFDPLRFCYDREYPSTFKHNLDRIRDAGIPHLTCLKVYPGNPRTRAILEFTRSYLGKACFQVIMRFLTKETAMTAGSTLWPKKREEREKLISLSKVKGLKVCSGHCGECRFCYDTFSSIYRCGTMSDPLQAVNGIYGHTIEELKRVF